LWNLVGQEAGPDVDVVAQWLQYGASGAVVVALLLGWLWAKPAVDRLLKDKDRLLEERTDQMHVLIGEVRELRREVREAQERSETRRDP
jgi:hypothetical protein